MAKDTLETKLRKTLTDEVLGLIKRLDQRLDHSVREEGIELLRVVTNSQTSRDRDRYFIYQEADIYLYVGKKQVVILEEKGSSDPGNYSKPRYAGVIGSHALCKRLSLEQLNELQKRLKQRRIKYD